MKYAVVIKPIGHIQSKPQHLSENLDEVLFGMNVEILKELDNNWYYIKTHYKYEGYINGNQLLIDDVVAKKWEKRKNCLVIQAFADILDIPAAEGHQIASITRGANIISTGELCENKKFVKVKIPTGEFGWIRKSFLQDLKTLYNIKDEENLRENLSKAALGYLGTQYRWGGKSPLGIDCSGLCSMAYMLNGINIYRNAEIKEGFPIKEILLKNIKKGDLIFFPGHMAMYLGNNKYIHSSNSNNVVGINSLSEDDDDYFEYLAKRIKKVGSIFY